MRTHIPLAILVSCGMSSLLVSIGGLMGERLTLALLGLAFGIYWAKVQVLPAPPLSQE